MKCATVVLLVALVVVVAVVECERHHHRHHHHIETQPPPSSEEEVTVEETEEEPESSEGVERRENIHVHRSGHNDHRRRHLERILRRQMHEEKRLVMGNREFTHLTRRDMHARQSIVSEASRINDQDLLDWHNGARWAIATGKVPRQPKAANMLAVEWDDRLAQKAAVHAESCPTMKHMHDTNADRKIFPFFVVGQNVATTPEHYVDKPNVNAWAEEVNDFDYSLNSYYPEHEAVVGHYQQVSWAYSSKLGCKFSDQCATDSNGKSNPLVCDYAFGANWGQQWPRWMDRVTNNYEQGEPCSKCPEGYGWCLAGGLCATTRMKDSSSTKHHCTLHASKCRGTFSHDDCYCACPDGFYGANCDVKCEDHFEDNARAAHMKTTYTSKEYCTQKSLLDACHYNNENFTSLYLALNNDCRKTCGRCSTWIGVKEFNSVDRRGLQTRVHQGRFFWRGYAEDESKTAMALCEDRNPQCGKWARAHACTSSEPGKHQHMVEECPNICGYCTPKGGRPQNTLKGTYGLEAATDENKNTKQCGNAYGDMCKQYKAGGMCEIEQYHDQMEAACAQECGFC